MSGMIMHTNPDGSTVQIPDTCKVYENVMIHDGVKIGEYVQIGEPNLRTQYGSPALTTIGKGAIVQSTPLNDNRDRGVLLKISSGVTIGEECRIDSHVPAGTTIGNRTRIDARVKLGSGEAAHGFEVPTGIKIGSSCYIGNDVTIGQNVTIGDFVGIYAKAVIESSVLIGDYVRIRPCVLIPKYWHVPKGYLANPHPRQEIGEPPVLLKYDD